jgi:hypothetical protein
MQATMVHFCDETIFFLGVWKHTKGEPLFTKKGDV